MSLRHPRTTGGGAKVFQDRRLGFIGYGVKEEDGQRGRAWSRRDVYTEFDNDFDRYADYLDSPSEESPLQGYNDSAPGSLPHSVSTNLKTNILREVDKFVMSLPLGTAQEDADIEEAVASRLYRTELAKAEAQNKLTEWVNVATELREIVQQQQEQLQQRDLLTSSSLNNSSQQLHRSWNGTHASRRDPMDQPVEPQQPLTHLQQLVQDMRAELRQPVGSGPAEHVNGGSMFCQPELQAELEKTKRQLKELQDSYDRMMDVKVQSKALHQQQANAELENEVKSLRLEIEHWRKVESGLKSEVERVRAALIDAEIEMQRGVNDMDVLKSQLQSATGAASQAQTAQQRQLEEISALRSQLQQASQHNAALMADNASLKQHVAELQGATQQLQQSSAGVARLNGQVASLREDLAEREAQVARLKDAADIAAEAAGQQQAASDALLHKMQLQISELEAALQSATSKAAAAAGVSTAECAALRAQLATAQRAQQHAEQELQRTSQQAQQAAASLESTQMRLQGAEAEQRELQDQLRQSREGARARHSRAPSPELLAQKDMEIRALEEVLARVRTAAQQKDAQIVAAQKERNAATEEVRRIREEGAEWMADKDSIKQRVQQAQEAKQEVERELAQAKQDLVDVQRARHAEQEEWQGVKSSLQEQLSKLEGDLAGLLDQKQALEVEIDTLRGQLRQEQDTVADQKQQLHALTAKGKEAEAAANQTKRVEAQVADLLSKIDTLRRGLAVKERDVAAANEAKEIVGQQLTQAQLQLEESQQQLIQREREHQQVLLRLQQRPNSAVTEAVAASRNIAALQERVRKAEDASLHAQCALQQASADKAALERQVHDLGDCIQGLEAELRDNAKEKQDCPGCREAQHRLRRLADAKAATEHQVAVLQADVKQLESQLAQRSQQAQQAEATVEGLRQQLDFSGGQLQELLHAQTRAQEAQAQEVASLAQQVQQLSLQLQEANARGESLTRQLAESRLGAGAAPGRAAVASPQHSSIFGDLEEQEWHGDDLAATPQGLQEQAAQATELQLAAALEEQEKVGVQLRAAEQRLTQAQDAHLQDVERLRDELVQQQAQLDAANQTKENLAGELAQLESRHATQLRRMEEEHQAELRQLEHRHAAWQEQAQQQRSAELASMHAAHAAELAGAHVAAAAAAAAPAQPGEWVQGQSRTRGSSVSLEEEMPSPMQRRLQQRLRQLEEEAVLQLEVLREQAQQEVASRHAAELQELKEQHAQQLEAQLADHEAQLLSARSQYESHLEAVELQHLTEMETAQEHGAWDAAATGGAQSMQLAARVRALEALRAKHEEQIQALSSDAQQQLRCWDERRAELEAQLSGAQQEVVEVRQDLQAKEDELSQRLAQVVQDHESQLASLMVKHSLLSEELEAQQAQQHHSARAAEAEVQAARRELHEQHCAQLEEVRLAHEAQLAALRELHLAQVSRVLTAAIFRNVLSAWESVRQAAPQPPVVGTSLTSAALMRAFRNSPNLHWLCEQPDTNHQDDAFSCPPSLADAPNPLDTPLHSTASSPQRPPRSADLRRSSCRITAAAVGLAQGEGDTWLSPAHSASGVQRRLLQGGVGASREGSPARPSSSFALSGVLGRGGSPSQGRTPGSASEAGRLAGMLEQALTELDIRTAALEECQDMLAELQAFSQTKKDQVTQLCEELEAQAASLRDAKDRLRAMEEQLLKSQTELAQVNSKSHKYERKCGEYIAELEGSQQELARREREALALTAQLTATQASHQQALGRLEQLAAALASAQSDKDRAERALAEAQQALAEARIRGSAGGNSHGMEALLQELLAAQQSIREEQSRPSSRLSSASGAPLPPGQHRPRGNSHGGDGRRGWSEDGGAAVQGDAALPLKSAQSHQNGAKQAQYPPKPGRPSSQGEHTRPPSRLSSASSPQQQLRAPTGAQRGHSSAPPSTSLPLPEPGAPGPHTSALPRDSSRQGAGTGRGGEVPHLLPHRHHTAPAELPHHHAQSSMPEGHSWLADGLSDVSQNLSTTRPASSAASRRATADQGGAAEGAGGAPPPPFRATRHHPTAPSELALPPHPAPTPREASRGGAAAHGAEQRTSAHNPGAPPTAPPAETGGGGAPSRKRQGAGEGEGEKDRGTEGDAPPPVQSSAEGRRGSGLSSISSLNYGDPAPHPTAPRDFWDAEEAGPQGVPGRGAGGGGQGPRSSWGQPDAPGALPSERTQQRGGAAAAPAGGAAVRSSGPGLLPGGPRGFSSSEGVEYLVGPGLSAISSLNYFDTPPELPGLLEAGPAQQQQHSVGSMAGGHRSQAQHPQPLSSQQGPHEQRHPSGHPPPHSQPQLPLLRPQSEQGAGDAGPETPASGVSSVGGGSEMWSDPGTRGAGPIKRKRGALHKLAKMLRGGGSSSKAQREGGQGDTIAAIHRMDSRDLMPPPPPRPPAKHVSPLAEGAAAQHVQQQHHPEQQVPPAHDQGGWQQQGRQGEGDQLPGRRREWRLQTLLEEQAEELRRQQGQLWLLAGGGSSSNSEGGVAGGEMPHPSALPPALRHMAPARGGGQARHPEGQVQGGALDPHPHQLGSRQEEKGGSGGQGRVAAPTLSVERAIPGGRESRTGSSQGFFGDAPPPGVSSSWEQSKGQYIYDRQEGGPLAPAPSPAGKPPLSAHAAQQVQRQGGGQGTGGVRGSWEEAGWVRPKDLSAAMHSAGHGGGLPGHLAEQESGLLSECPSPSERQYGAAYRLGMHGGRDSPPPAQHRQQLHHAQQQQWVHTNALFDD